MELSSSGILFHARSNNFKGQSLQIRNLTQADRKDLVKALQGFFGAAEGLKSLQTLQGLIAWMGSLARALSPLKDAHVRFLKQVQDHVPSSSKK